MNKTLLTFLHIVFYVPYLFHFMPRSLVDVLTENNLDDGDYQFLGISPYVDDDEFIEQLNRNHTFVLLSTNAQSIRAKIDEITLMLYQYNHLECDGIAVFCVQETWIGKENNFLFPEIPNYVCVHKPYSASTHGGLATYIRNDLHYYVESSPPHTEALWENLFVVVSGDALGNRKILVGNIYRPPRERVELVEKFISEFKAVTESLNKYSNVYVMGDYNLDALKCDTDPRISAFLEQSIESGYLPKILLPTRITGFSETLIDNCLCKSISLFGHTEAGILTHSISDHQPYFVSINLPERSTKPKRPDPTYRYTVKMSHDAKMKFKEMLENKLTMNNFNLDENANPQENMQKFQEIIDDAHKQCFKQKRVRCDRRKDPKSPWITRGLIRSIKTRNKLYKKLKRFKDISSDRYSILKMQVKNFNLVLKKSMKLAKKSYYTKLFDRYKNDPRKTWSLIKEMTTISNKNETVTEFVVEGKKINDVNKISKSFNEYFLQIPTKMSATLGQATNHFSAYLGEKVKTDFRFQPIDENTVQKAINSLKCKFTLDCYGLSTELIKICKFQISKPLTLIINQCIKNNIFPDQMKIARVLAIYKKGDKSIFDNYRPISILPIISKIFERILHTQLSHYFTSNNLFCENQYGFRKNHSTELAALELVDSTLLNLEDHRSQISTFMDLSKAFDCIDHSILKQKLVHYGLSNSAIDMINNYLSNRKQFVDINGTKSDLGTIKMGVPQGSIIGPLLFLIYINDITKSTGLLSAILYADDSTFTTTVQTDDSFNDTINSELEKIHTWLISNRLCLNTTKTKYIIFNRTHSDIDLQLHINNNKIEQVNTFNFLGLMINQNLNWSTHINALKRKLSRNIGILRLLKTKLPYKVLTSLYYTLIHPHLNYMILLWGQDNDIVLKKQKQALRLIHCSHYLSHTDPLYKASNILKVTDLYTQSQLKFCHKYIHGQLPGYCLKLNFESNNDSHDYNTRRGDQLRCPKIRSEGGRRCLRNSIPKLINSLDDSSLNNMYNKSCKAMAGTFKFQKISSYSSSTKCDDANCYSCSIIFGPS